MILGQGHTGRRKGPQGSGDRASWESSEVLVTSLPYRFLSCQWNSMERLSLRTPAPALQVTHHPMPWSGLSSRTRTIYSRQVRSLREKLNSRILRPVRRGTSGQEHQGQACPSAGGSQQLPSEVVPHRLPLVFQMQRTDVSVPTSPCQTHLTTVEKALRLTVQRLGDAGPWGTGDFLRPLHSWDSI